MEFNPASPLTYTNSPRLVAVQETSNTAFKYTPAPGTGDQAICMFVNMVTFVQYRASSCTSNGLGAFTARAPFTTSITPLALDSWWRLVITTAGLESQNGVNGLVSSNGVDFPNIASFPSKRYTLKLTIEGGKNCEESLYITGPAPATASIKLISVNRGCTNNVLFVTVKTTCYYDTTTPTVVPCTVVSHGFVYTGTRNSRMEMKGIVIASNASKDIAILGITNPSTAMPLWMDLQVHTIDLNGIMIIKYFTRLQYVAQISGTPAGTPTSGATKLLGTLGSTAVLLSATTLTLGATIPLGGYAYVQFTENIETGVTLTDALFMLPLKKLIIVKATAALTELTLTYWKNPSSMPTSPSSITVSIFDLSSLYSAGVSFPVTYTANTFTLALDSTSPMIIDTSL
ncbi:MAG: hypothetical protein J0651_00435, partial [Actinobacteria bacterium]|nr:hypothetical protein [Actinomycetota bacterium]